MSRSVNNKTEKIIEEFKEEQRKKFKRFAIFMISLSLILSGISGGAAYSLAAGQIGYTPKDTTWTVQNAGDAIDELRDNIGASLVGSIFSYMGTTAPYGYLACDGTEYNIADYPRLADHINAHFGSINYFGGDGTTTFAVPDLRGEFLRGTGTNSHSEQGNGDSVGVHQDATVLPGLYGSQQYREIGIEVSGVSKYDYATNNINTFVYVNGSVYASSSISGNKFTSRPTNTSVLYIIKY